MRVFSKIYLAILWIASTAWAQNNGVVLTYIPTSSVKLEQIIGDCDWQYLDWSSGKGTCKPTASQTATRFKILGNGEGYTFENNGKLLFLSGDTMSADPNTSFHGGDPVGFSTTTDGEAPFLLNYYTDSNGLPLFVCRGSNSQCGNIATGGDDIPNSGISLPDGVYLVYHSGSDTSLPNPAAVHANNYSVLISFDENAKSFTAGRTISKLTNGVGGHFIITSLHASGPDVYMYGVGLYRASDIYLSKTPAATFKSGIGTQYFADLVNGQPTWTNSESAAVPVVQDNPLNGPAWPNDSPSVGKMSVTYSSDLNLWLMTYDGGRQSNATTGVYFTYATQPWGPWATPQLIFNKKRDHALGVFIHDPSIVPDPPGDGLHGPQNNDPYTTQGDDDGPLMIERFTKVSGNTLKIYYVLGTWNPYTVVKMRSEFTIGHAASINAGGIVNNASYAPSVAPGQIAAIFGSNLTDGASCLPPSCNPTFDNNGKLNTTMTGAQVTVNNTPVPIFYATPGQLGVQIPFELTGTSATVVVSVGGQSSMPAMINVTPVSPGIFTATADGKGAGAITHVNGAAVTAQNPAQPTELVIFYATGLGQVAPAVATGALPAGLSNTVAPVTLNIGGITVVPEFAGLAGCCVGLNQINARIPASVNAGDAVPVLLNIGGKSSNMASIAVR